MHGMHNLRPQPAARLKLQSLTCPTLLGHDMKRIITETHRLRLRLTRLLIQTETLYSDLHGVTRDIWGMHRRY